MLDSTSDLKAIMTPPAGDSSRISFLYQPCQQRKSSYTKRAYWLIILHSHLIAYTLKQDNWIMTILCQVRNLRENNLFRESNHIIVFSGSEVLLWISIIHRGSCMCIPCIRVLNIAHWHSTKWKVLHCYHVCCYQVSDSGNSVQLIKSYFTQVRLFPVLDNWLLSLFLLIVEKKKYSVKAGPVFSWIRFLHFIQW